MDAIRSLPVEQLPAALAAAISAFAQAEPRLASWRAFPHISEDADIALDTWACEGVSRDFLPFARRFDLDAALIYGDDALPDCLEHFWVRVRTPDSRAYDVDFTARQFYSIIWPPPPELTDLPCPLIWPASDTHPVVGDYRRVSELAT